MWHCLLFARCSLRVFFLCLSILWLYCSYISSPFTSHRVVVCASSVCASMFMLSIHVDVIMCRKNSGLDRCVYVLFFVKQEKKQILKRNKRSLVYWICIFFVTFLLIVLKCTLISIRVTFYDCSVECISSSKLIVQ